MIAELFYNDALILHFYSTNLSFLDPSFSVQMISPILYECQNSCQTLQLELLDGLKTSFIITLLSKLRPIVGGMFPSFVLCVDVIFCDGCCLKSFIGCFYPFSCVWTLFVCDGYYLQFFVGWFHYLRCV